MKEPVSGSKRISGVIEDDLRFRPDFLPDPPPFFFAFLFVFRFTELLVAFLSAFTDAEDFGSLAFSFSGGCSSSGFSSSRIGIVSTLPFINLCRISAHSFSIGLNL